MQLIHYYEQLCIKFTALNAKIVRFREFVKNKEDRRMTLEEFEEVYGEEVRAKRKDVESLDRSILKLEKRCAAQKKKSAQFKNN